MVLPFAGTSEIATAATEGVESRLQQLNQFRATRLADHRDKIPQSNGRQTEMSREELLYFARMLGVDAAIVGQVDQQVDKGSNFGNFNIMVGDPTVDVSLDIAVIDVHSGKPITQKTVTKSFQGPLAETDIEFGARPTKEVIAELLNQCLDEGIACLSPQSEIVEVELATARDSDVADDVEAGNAFAQQGNWRAAKVAYESGLRKDHQHHAVLYNLGIANEALGEYDQAALCVQSALALNDEAGYANSLARIQESQHNQSLALAHATQQSAKRQPNNTPANGDSITSHDLAAHQPFATRHASANQQASAHLPTQRTPSYQLELPQQHVVAEIEPAFLEPRYPTTTPVRSIPTHMTRSHSTAKPLNATQLTTPLTHERHVAGGQEQLTPVIPLR